MKRRTLLAAVVPVVSCRRASQASAETVLPDTVADVWHRTELRQAAHDAALHPIPGAGVARILNATYEGPGKIHVSLYELKSSAGALDAAQRWKPQANTVFFYRQNYFAVVQWESAERDALSAFVRKLEEHLG